MSEAELPERKPAPWHDRLSDWFNAILIRESRQALKSKQFVATFMLLLAIAWVVSVFGLLNSGSALEFGSVGRDFFYYFYCALAFAALVLIPFGAFRSLQAERDLNTYDLLSITALKPRQIVWGKLLSIGLQLFLFYSAITPFMAFASLLQGFNTGTAIIVLVGTMLYSFLLAMAALMLSSFARQKALQGLFGAGMLIGLVSNFFWIVFGIGVALRFDAIAIASPDFWWGAGIVVTAFVAYFILFQQIAVAQLTFETDNRSTGIRVITTIQFWLLWAIVGIYCFARQTAPPDYVRIALAVVSALHLAVAGLVFSTEGDFLTRRVQREIPRNRLWRYLKAPYLPGGARGLLLAVFHLVALWWIMVACQSFEVLRPAGMSLGEYYASLTDLQSPVWNRPLRVTTVLCAYTIIYLSIATLLGRIGRRVSNEVKPAHIRVIIILLVTAGIIFPLILRAAEAIKETRYTVFDITSPPVTVEELVRRHPTQRVELADYSRESLQNYVGKRGYGDLVIVLLVLTACLGVAINGWALVRSVTGLKPLQRARPEDSP